MTITEVMRLSERIFKMYSPLTGELYQAGEYEYEDSADEYNGEELLLYAEEIEKAVKAYTDNGTEDLMKYFYESEYVKQHVRSLVPSVEVWNGRLYGCTTVRADEDLSEPVWDKLMDYLSAVSYTHLDVYKRQGYGGCSHRRCSRRTGNHPLLLR